MGCGCKKKTIINPQAPQAPPPPPPPPPQVHQPARPGNRITLRELATHTPPMPAQPAPKNDVEKILEKLNTIKH